MLLLCSVDLQFTDNRTKKTTKTLSCLALNEISIPEFIRIWNFLENSNIEQNCFPSLFAKGTLFNL